MAIVEGTGGPVLSGGTKKNNPFVSSAVTGALAGLNQVGRPTSGSTGSSGGGGGTTVIYQQPSGPSYGDILAQIQREQQAARDRAYNEGVAAQKRNLEYSTEQVDNATNRALQEAYINRMMTQRNLPQTMSAQGLTGGAAESTIAGLYNNYGNARNELERERVEQISALQQAYNNNLAQLEAQRASGAVASLSELAPVLMNLVASNPQQLVSMQQASTPVTTPITTGVGGWYDEEGNWHPYR